MARRSRRGVPPGTGHPEQRQRHHRHGRGEHRHREHRAVGASAPWARAPPSPPAWSQAQTVGSDVTSTVDAAGQAVAQATSSVHGMSIAGGLISVGQVTSQCQRGERRQPGHGDRVEHRRPGDGGRSGGDRRLGRRAQPRLFVDGPDTGRADTVGVADPVDGGYHHGAHQPDRHCRRRAGRARSSTACRSSSTWTRSTRT